MSSRHRVHLVTHVPFLCMFLLASYVLSTDFIAIQWEPLLPADALATVRTGAYYTVSPAPGLRLISFNSIYCDHLNVWAILNQTDHAGQFAWLNATLTAARAAGERVYIIGHITPTDYFSWCRQQYMSMAIEYADVIEAHFWYVHAFLFFVFLRIVFYLYF